MALCAEMLVLGKAARSERAARKQLSAALDSGAAAEKFQQMVAAMGGPKNLVSRPWAHLERAPLQVAIPPRRAGKVAAVETRALGMAVVAIGGGRTRPQDPIDHAVGLTELAGIGDAVGPDRPLAVVHARTAAQVETATVAVQSAYRISGRGGQPGPVVLERITAGTRGGGS